MYYNFNKTKKKFYKEKVLTGLKLYGRYDAKVVDKGANAPTGLGLTYPLITYDVIGLRQAIAASKRHIFRTTNSCDCTNI